MDTMALDFGEFNFSYKIVLNLLAILISFLAVVYWLKIYKQLYKKDDKEVRGWRWIFVGILSILLFNITSLYFLILVPEVYLKLNLSRIFPNAINAVTFWDVSVMELFNILGRTIVAVALTGGAYLLYAPMRDMGSAYRFVPTEPSVEPGSVENLKYNLKPSTLYLVKEEKPIEGSKDIIIKGVQPKRSLELFSDLVSHGFPGLCITRMHPDKIKEQYNLQNTPILWLTQSMEVRSRINPSDLLELSQTVREFVRRTKKSVILLDGLEYLITQNNFDEILRLVQSLNDLISVSSSIVIIPIDPSTLETQKLHLLEREMSEIMSMLGR